MLEIPVGLKHALETGECVLFLGAGIGTHLFDENGNPAPDANDLVGELIDHFNLDVEGIPDLAKISAYIELTMKGRSELETYLKKRLSKLKPDAIFQWLFTLRWRAIFTTNYDDGIERAYGQLANPKQQPIPMSVSSDIVSYDPYSEVPIVHLHGTLFGTTGSKIIITEDDYVHFQEKRRMLFEFLKLQFATSTVLYIGYSNRDPNWKSVLQEMTSEFSRSLLRVSYRIAPNTDSIEKELLRAKNIETIEGNLKDFHSAAIVALSPTDVSNESLLKAKNEVPLNLIGAFNDRPVAVLRLLRSWTYVNQAPFNETPNLNSFLRGDRPNWALVGANKIFERDIEEDLFDNVLDYVTSSSRRPKANILLAPAGYGVTTLLMRLASRLAIEQSAVVFALKPGASVLLGDIEFACTLFPAEIPVFLVDNAADYGNELSLIVDHLKNIGQRALFLLGERLNEWKQSRAKPQAKEFGLDPLSDPEINRLLDYLSANSALNVLENLSRDIQFNSIKKNYNKDLLVVMREATEGKRFDAILESEFHGIGTSLARKLYLTVCCFHQHGTYVRDTLLAQLLNITVADLYQDTEKETVGVVFFDSINEAHGIHAARARHRIIARVIWERCGEQAEREMILQSALANLNLNYKADKIAFDEFVRNENVVDSIQTFDGRTKFFETACRKDPESPYVRQHYARMLQRQNIHESALAQIERAIHLNPRVRVLYHTKGLILSDLASSAPSLDVARRQLSQSEAEFKRGLSMSPSDEYFYQGLATLYFNWAKRPTITGEEMADYLAKAESVISEGLKDARAKESLWIVSSEIQAWLGDTPSHIEALTNAVKDNPSGIVSRYLLGRVYRKLGHAQKTLEVLEPVIKNHFNEFRSFVEYALALEKLGRPYKQGIAILEQSRLDGLHDPRFIATLGGMRFMNGEFTEAARIFEESTRRNFSLAELNKVEVTQLKKGR